MASYELNGNALLPLSGTRFTSENIYERQPIQQPIRHGEAIFCCPLFLFNDPMTDDPANDWAKPHYPVVE